MQVNLVWSTPDAEKLLLYIARVSNPANQDSQDTKLIQYLIRNKHWSPFEMVSMCVEIETSRAIGEQILRHRSFSFQEFCITGDSLITLKLPSGNTYKRTIAQLYKLKSYKNQHTKRNGLPLARIYNESTGEFTNARILDVFDTGLKPVFEIELYNGKKIKATKDHRFLTKDGFLPLEQIIGLKLEDNKAVMTKVGFIACNGQPVYRSYDWMYEAKQEAISNKSGVAGIAIKAGVSYHTIRKWLKIHNLSFTKREVASYTETWNKGKFGYKNTPMSEDTREKMCQSARRGSESHLWKGGVERSTRMKIADWCQTIRHKKLKEVSYACVFCGSNHKLELDHIIPVYADKSKAFDEKNIQVLCSACHDKKHRLSGDVKVWGEKHKGNTLTVVWSKIKYVTYLGVQQTYDMQVDHTSHNYVANGIVTHNSQRYATVPTVEPIELRKQAVKNRQSSTDVFDPVLDSWEQPASIVVNQFVHTCQQTYNELIQAGVAKECARMILPMAATTKIYMHGTLRSWIHYLSVRRDEHAQKEHGEIADRIHEIARDIFPHTFAALEEEKKREEQRDLLE